MAKTKKRRDLLPKRAPKRTGKRGPRPLDAKEDFEKPAKKKDQLLKDAARQARLPGMEDTAISAIEAAAYEYDDAKKRRMKLLEREVELKDKLRQVMKAHTTKSTYRHDDVLVILTPAKEEGIKVVIGDEEKLDAVQKASQAEYEASRERMSVVPPIESLTDEAQAEADAKEMAEEESLDKA